MLEYETCPSDTDDYETCPWLQRQPRSAPHLPGLLRHRLLQPLWGPPLSSHQRNTTLATCRGQIWGQTHFAPNLPSKSSTSKDLLNTCKSHLGVPDVFLMILDAFGKFVVCPQFAPKFPKLGANWGQICQFGGKLRANTQNAKTQKKIVNTCQMA